MTTHADCDDSPTTRLGRLVRYWVYGGFLFSFVLLAYVGLMPDASWGFILIYLHLPAYLWHQYEEHDGGVGFRHFFNETLGGGKEVLTHRAIFVINTIAVWALFTVFVVVARRLGVGWGLCVVYPTLVNGVAHAAAALRSRAYNPGLATAVGLFLPLTLTTIAVLARDSAATGLHHIVGLAVGLGAHAAIGAYVMHRRRLLG